MVSDTPTPTIEVELGDTQTKTADIHVRCAECGNEQLLEYGYGHLTGPCRECSTPGSEDTRAVSSLSIMVHGREVFGSPEPVDSETDIEAVLTNLATWKERMESLVDGEWDVEYIHNDSETIIRFKREIRSDDGIGYGELVDQDRAYIQMLEAEKQKATGEA